mgnify:CR=1 FL=1
MLSDITPDRALLCYFSGVDRSATTLGYDNLFVSVRTRRNRKHPEPEAQQRTLGTNIQDLNTTLPLAVGRWCSLQEAGLRGHAKGALSCRDDAWEPVLTPPFCRRHNLISTTCRGCGRLGRHP